MYLVVQKVFRENDVLCGYVLRNGEVESYSDLFDFYQKVANGEIYGFSLKNEDISVIDGKREDEVIASSDIVLYENLPRILLDGRTQIQNAIIYTKLPENSRPVYRNEIDVNGVLDKKNYLNLNWEMSRKNTLGKGVFPKTSYIENGIKYYIKLSKYQSGYGIVGHESVSELIVSRLLKLLDIENFNYVNYELLYGDIYYDGNIFSTYFSRSQDYSKGLYRQSLEDFYNQNKVDGETPLGLLRRFGLQYQIYCFFIVDYIVSNIDRHGSNIEIFYVENTPAIAPLFDSGMSLSALALREDDIHAGFNLNFSTTNFVGSNILEENLRYIDQSIIFNRDLKFNDLDILFDNLSGVLRRETLVWIKNFIWRRYCYVREINFGKC